MTSHLARQKRMAGHSQTNQHCMPLHRVAAHDQAQDISHRMKRSTFICTVHHTKTLHTQKLPVLLPFRSPIVQYVMLSLYKCSGQTTVITVMSVIAIVTILQKINSTIKTAFKMSQCIHNTKTYH